MCVCVPAGELAAQQDALFVPEDLYLAQNYQELLFDPQTPPKKDDQNDRNGERSNRNNRNEENQNASSRDPPPPALGRRGKEEKDSSDDEDCDNEPENRRVPAPDENHGAQQKKPSLQNDLTSATGFNTQHSSKPGKAPLNASSIIEQRRLQHLKRIQQHEQQEDSSSSSARKPSQATSQAMQTQLQQRNPQPQFHMPANVHLQQPPMMAPAIPLPPAGVFPQPYQVTPARAPSSALDQLIAFLVVAVIGLWVKKLADWF